MKIKLREWRLASFVTQEELAQRSGLTEVSISRIETGVREPRISTVRRLAEALGITPQQLVDGPGADNTKAAA